MLLVENFRKHKFMYIFMIPGVIYFIIFHYVPMYGIIIAFKDFKFNLGILRSEWVGLKYFRTLFVFSGLWKEAGWGTIIYLSAITSIDKSLYEAAIVDGANRLKQVWHITLPGIASTICVVLILRVGSMMSSNFEYVFILYNLLVYSVADVFSTYIYRVGIGQARFSYTTAIGIFQSVVGFVLILTSNYFSRRVSEWSIW